MMSFTLPTAMHSSRLVLSCLVLGVQQAFKFIGMDITWVGQGVEEYGHQKDDPDNVLVRVDPRYFRPTEVDLLVVSCKSSRVRVARGRMLVEALGGMVRLLTKRFALGPAYG